VVDSVEKKWVWEKKGFADRKNADLKRFLVVYRNIKSILNGLKGITIMFKTKV
jgi:hypothetical protein